MDNGTRTIYLAKSQLCDDALLRAVNSYLRGLARRYGLEILEHSGSSASYDPSIARGAHHLVIVPPLHSGADCETAYIGRGVYGTLKDYFENDPEDTEIESLLRSQTPLVAVINDGVMGFCPIERSEYLGRDWKLNWARLSLGDIVDPEQYWNLAYKPTSDATTLDEPMRNESILLARRLGRLNKKG